MTGQRRKELRDRMAKREVIPGDEAWEAARMTPEEIAVAGTPLLHKIDAISALENMSVEPIPLIARKSKKKYKTPTSGSTLITISIIVFVLSILIFSAINKGTSKNSRINNDNYPAEHNPFFVLLGFVQIACVVGFIAGIIKNKKSKTQKENDQNLIIKQQYELYKRYELEQQGLNRHIPTSVKQNVWRRDNGRCILCGSTNHLHYDHEIPVSKGGSNIEQNIRILCRSCNLSKSAKIE